jgi:RNA polymerase sigma factor (sigma-70 family)
MGLNEPTPVQKPTTESSRSIEFTTFMRAYQNMVFSTAARLAGNDAQAEDIAQEVFIKAYENFEHLRLSATAGGWLKTVATNLSLNYLTRYRKRWRLFSESESVPDVALPDGALDTLGEEEQRAALEEALRWSCTTSKTCPMKTSPPSSIFRSRRSRLTSGAAAPRLRRCCGCGESEVARER